ncbi:uncharacterized protein LOC123269630 [Cotesia glomerata]|uniref:uncharacterized protein LOC123269630 n=1 Tax=Cotesia glomerata TaxID=32391 RepID=UPI001D035873|nr:uncharacterized protein LOC123269630 [Cotesia glomerata]
MGWSKRGNGKSYDSLNGYGTIIGFLSGKILDYADRIRKCKFCDLGRKKEDHDCRKNFVGSAKAMEASAGADLVNNSTVLKEANLEARVLIGDEDSCTIAANCGSWCCRRSGSGEQTILLTNLTLFDQLSAVCDKYAASANKFSIPASSQANESFNNIMAHKSPKNICYSKSESSSYRLASSVCTKNDGDSCIVGIRKKLKLSPGLHTSLYAELSDNKRKKRAIDAKLPVAKKRRVLVTQEREKLRKKNENSEGVQYKSNCGLSQDGEDFEAFDESQIKGPDIQMSPETCNLVFFDLETSGFRKSDEILQIAASCKGRKFSVYINPTKIIDDKASAHTGLKNINGDLYFHAKKVESLPLKKALQSFLMFLKMSPKPCLLVAHNVTFDKSHLLRSILKCSMVPAFSKIAGFSDSLPLFKKNFTSKKISGEYKLSELAKNHLNVNSDDKFHEALYDVEILEKLVSLTDNKHLFESSKSYRECLIHLKKLKKTASGMDCLSPLKGVLSGHILRKMASQAIKYQDLINKYENGGINELIKFCKEPGSDNKPNITKDKRVLDKLCSFFTKKM